MSYKLSVPLLIKEHDQGYYVFNPGGRLDKYRYEESIKPFVYLDVTNKPEWVKPKDKIKDFTELATLKKLKIKRSFYYNINDYNKYTRKEYLPTLQHYAQGTFIPTLVEYYPQKIRDFAKPDELKVLCFDLEIGTQDGRFPDSSRDPIIAWGACILGKKYIDPNDNDIIINIDKKNEKQLLEDLLSLIVKENPDVVSGYFSSGFDSPYLIDRCLKLGIDLNILNRSKTNREIDWKGKDGVALSLGYGRLHYDIYAHDVVFDTMIKTKNKKMKTVAEFYGLKDIYDLDTSSKSNLNDVDNKEIFKYLVSDLRCTMHLASKYIPVTIKLAEYLGWPFSFCLYRTTGKMSDLALGYLAYKDSYISLFKNKNKFPVLMDEIQNSPNGKFEGAYNWAHDPIIYDDIDKLDFTSMYPSSMLQFNLSSDTTTLEGIESIDYEKIPIKDVFGIGKENCLGFLENEDHYFYTIPDKNLNKRLIIKVLKKEGFTSRLIKDLMKQRSDVKTKMKSHDTNSVEYKILDSEQLAIKILVNSIYGAYGSGIFKNTSIICGIFVTAACREITKSLHKKHLEKVLEVDTDGLMIKKYDNSLEEFNLDVIDLIKKKYKFKKVYMILEQEYASEQVGILISKKKNYCTFKGNKVKLSGANFTSSQFPKFFEEMTKEMVHYVFTNLYNPNIQNLFESLAKEKIDSLNYIDSTNFIMSFSIKKDIYDYTSLGKPSDRVLDIYYNNKFTKAYKLILDVLNSIKSTITDIELQDKISLYIQEVDKNESTFLKKILDICSIIEEEKSFTYGQYVKLFDLYRDKHKKYPTIGETIDYYYSINTTSIDLYENLTSRHLIDITKYQNRLKDIFQYIREALPKENIFNFI